MPTLHIQLLGDFHLSYGDQPVTGVNTARLQALLAYLLRHRHAPQARQHLAFLFWPDTTEAQALTNLRNLLHKLRHALPAPDRFLLVDTKTVQWQADAPFTWDVADFEAAATQAITHPELAAAVKLYRGALLPSCYDDWIRPEREKLQQRAVDVLTRLIALLEAANDYRAALGYGQQLLQLDPYNEAVYCHLMRLHAANGDRAGLLRVYHNCVAILRAELAAEPAPATTELYARLLHNPALPVAVAQSPALVATNLPTPVSSFVGRQHEMTEIKALLRVDQARPAGVEQNPALSQRPPPMARLVTLTGAGGSGKTRLALHVATDLVDAYKDGVWWVELVSLLDGSLVAQTVAKIFAMRELANESLLTTLAQFLQGKELLLVLDNCEHLVDACAQLAYTLLSRCPKLHILATSRELLGITGEHFYPVPTLALPDPHAPLLPEFLLQYAALNLFVERAQGIDALFRLTPANAAAVLQTCRQLDGIPLALELAAARVRVLAVDQIAARLSDRLNLLTTGSRTAPPRHQTLRATLDWSYDLLTHDERLLLRRLAVFTGSFTLEAVEAVCGALSTLVLDVLAHLVDKSLVTVEPLVDGVQYRWLETIREYAREKLLTSGEAEQLRMSHLHFFTYLAEAAYQQAHGAEQERWLAQLERVHDNVRIALRRAMERGKVSEALRLSGAMGLFWTVRGHWREGRTWLEQALALRHQVATDPSSVSAMDGWSALALWRSGELRWRQCDFADARAHLEESLTLYRQLDDQTNLADVIGLLGGVAFEQGEYAATRAFYAESLAVGRSLENQHRIAIAHFGLGLAAYHQEDYAQAQLHLTESLALLQESGHRRDTSYPLNALGNLANLRGDYATARTLYEECLTLRRELGYKRGVAATLNDLANVTAKQGDAITARVLYAQSITLFRDLGNPRGMVWALSGLARLWQAQGHHPLAAQLLAAVAALLKAMHARLDEPEHSDNEQAVALLRTQLDAAGFDRAWTAGQRLTIEQAIMLAQQSA